MPKRALLIGAGFSYDLGMPLTNDLTKDLFYYFNDKRIKILLNTLKDNNPYGSDRPINKKSFEIIYKIYSEHCKGANYEDFLKEIQEQYNDYTKKQDEKDTFHYFFGVLLDYIFEMFWMYQFNNYKLYQQCRHFYNNFSNLIVNDELWVISLNHDLIIEFICFDNNLPLSFGSTDVKSFPLNNLKLNSNIDFFEISRNNLSLDQMHFFRDECGVNLIKLHGGINEFTYGDDSKILHIKPDNNETSQSYLNKVNKVIHKMCYIINGIPARLCKEIAISDYEGEMQFLSKSIITGGYKYSKTFDPKPGEEKMRLLEEVLSLIDELYIIGYGFYDKHVNLRLYNAMLLNKNLKIWRVDPKTIEVPDILEPFNYNLRVRSAMCGTPEWLSYRVSEKWDNNQISELKRIRTNREAYDEGYRRKYLSL